MKNIRLQPNDVSAMILFKNGKKQKMEVQHGASFLSQSARFLTFGENVGSVDILETNGKTRKINF